LRKKHSNRRYWLFVIRYFILISASFLGNQFITSFPVKGIEKSSKACGISGDPAIVHRRQLKPKSKGIGKYVVAGFIPARTANLAVVHRLIKRRSIKDMHKIQGGDKPRRYTGSL
jgi:hypothetical protein